MKSSMTAEEILQLLDVYWFEHEILFKGKLSLPSPSKLVEQEDHEVEEAKPSPIVNLQFRSFSDRCLRIDSSFSPSPRSVITTTKLEKILSGEEIDDFSKEIEEQEKIGTVCRKNESRKRRRRTSMSRSLSDLEFEELKGFMDLGFVFTEEDKKSSLVSIIPGLQRWGKRDDEKGKFKYDVSRPYLSEAWEVLDQTKFDKPLMMHWKFPALHNEINMKDNLKAWAHTVATTVR